jgi:hypothetical protein
MLSNFEKGRPEMLITGDAYHWGMTVHCGGNRPDSVNWEPTNIPRHQFFLIRQGALMFLHLQSLFFKIHYLQMLFAALICLDLRIRLIGLI